MCSVRCPQRKGRSILQSGQHNPRCTWCPISCFSNSFQRCDHKLESWLRHVQRSSKIPRTTANDFGRQHRCCRFVFCILAALEIRRPEVAAMTDQSCGEDLLEHAAVLRSEEHTSELQSHSF